MKILKADCPECARVQNCDVLKQHSVKWADDHVLIDGKDIYRILRCRGCDTVFFGSSHFFSEDYSHQFDPISGEHFVVANEKKEYWPKASAWEYPKWFSHAFSVKFENLADLLEAIYEAYENERLILAAIGVRTCFDYSAERLGISPDMSFKEKVNALRKNGHISPREMSTLTILTEAGSAAAHRSWKPNKKQCELIIDTLESFIHRSIILPEGLDNLSESVPKRAHRAENGADTDTSVS